MKAKELREKKVDDLNKQLLGLLREHFNLRMQRAHDQLSQHSRLRSVRRDIARIKTVLTEQKKQKIG